jgi:hypothetical protein
MDLVTSDFMQESGAEDEIEDALEALLDAQTEGFGEGKEDEDQEDDYQDSDLEHNPEDDGEEDDEDDESSDGNEADYLGLKRARQDLSDKDHGRAKKSKSNILGQEPHAEEEDEEEEESLSKKDPPSFSRVDTASSREVLEQTFPLYLQSEAEGFTVTLQAGEMLYLPAGWFHEVKSLGTPSGGGHMAINYWFHPPDGTVFEKPYQSNFWESDWRGRKIDSEPMEGQTLTSTTI